MVTTTRTPRDGLASAASRFAIVGPRGEKVATLLVTEQILRVASSTAANRRRSRPAPSADRARARRCVCRSRGRMDAVPSPPPQPPVASRKPAGASEEGGSGLGPRELHLVRSRNSRLARAEKARPSAGRRSAPAWRLTAEDNADRNAETVADAFAVADSCRLLLAGLSGGPAARRPSPSSEGINLTLSARRSAGGRPAELPA